MNKRNCRAWTSTTRRIK